MIFISTYKIDLLLVSRSIYIEYAIELMSVLVLCVTANDLF